MSAYAAGFENTANMAWSEYEARVFLLRGASTLFTSGTVAVRAILKPTAIRSTDPTSIIGPE